MRGRGAPRAGVKRCGDAATRAVAAAVVGATAANRVPAGRSLYQEPASALRERGPMKLAALLLGGRRLQRLPRAGVPGPGTLVNFEPGFFIVG